MAVSLGDVMQALRADAGGKVPGELPPGLKAALDTYTGSYTSTMNALQRSYDNGLAGLTAKIGEMAAKYEATAVANSDDARALIRELLLSQKNANQQQEDLNAQWRDLAESYFPQISREQLLNEIAKRKETQKRLDLLKQELGLDKERWDIAKEQRKAAIQPQVQKLDTEMGLLDKFGGLGKDPVVGNLVTALKANLQGRKDTLTKGADKDIAEMEKEHELRMAAFSDLSKQREQDIGAFQKMAQGAFAGMTGTREQGGKPAAAKTPPVARVLPEQPAELATEPPVATRAAPQPPAPSSEPPVARKLSEQAADEAINKMMASQPDLPTGVAPKGAPAGKAIAVGALGARTGAVNLGGLGTALGGAISKGLSSLSGVLFKALGPLDWLVSIGQSIDGVVPVFSSTFGALHDVLRMAGPFLTALAIEGVTTLLTGINGIAFALDELIHVLPGMGDSMREQAEKSGAMATARVRAQADAEKVEKAQEQSRGGFTPFAPLASAGGVTVSRQGAPVLDRNETALTTPSEERAIMAPAPAAPAPATPDQSPLVSALQRITAPQNPGTTAIFPVNPYLQPFAV
jgi:hypothetical protein